MPTKQLLDCTLRDGGYVNDWEFGRMHLLSIFERLCSSGVDIIEVGFIDERRPYDVNRSIYNDTASIARTYEGVSYRPRMVVGMIDYGTCSLSHIQNQKDSFLDGIRVIFKKQKMHEAMAYCAELKKLGYKVFSQLVSITAYDEKDLIEITSLVNEVKPYAVSMVDTYGLLTPKRLLNYYNYLDEHVDPKINIGFHAHNNLELGFANCMAFLDKPTSRNTLVDGSLYGMGKSAGNAPIELVAQYMNSNHGSDYKLSAMLEAIEESIKSIYHQKPWGYKTIFYLSAIHECHPSYVDLYLKKDNLSLSLINELLKRIQPHDRKLLFDRTYAEELYHSFICEKADEKSALQKLRDIVSNHTLLLVGPGQNIKLQRETVNRFLTEKAPLVIALNDVPDFPPPNIIFVTRMNRYQELCGKKLNQPGLKIIATSNITSRYKSFDCLLSREPLLEMDEDIKDNSFLMLLKALKGAGVKEVFCAGFDGYSGNHDNYSEPNREYDFVKAMAPHLNSHMREVVKKLRSDMVINFITWSEYDQETDPLSASD